MASTSITTIHIDPPPKPARIRVNPRKPVCCQHHQLKPSIDLGDGMRRDTCASCGHTWLRMPLGFPEVRP